MYLLPYVGWLLKKEEDEEKPAVKHIASGKVLPVAKKTSTNSRCAPTSSSFMPDNKYSSDTVC